MFKRRWKYFGALKSDDGAELKLGHKSVRYSDERGSFEFGCEDGYLFPSVRQIAGSPIHLNERELSIMLERVMSGLKSDGMSVDLYPDKRQSNLNV